MRIEGTFLRTRIARRILAIFTLSTFLPLMVATGLTYLYGSRQLRSQAQRELHELVKSQGMSVFDRLSLASAELSGVLSEWRSGSGLDGADAPRIGPGELSTLSHVMVVRDGGPPVSLAGEPTDAPPRTGEVSEHLDSGKPVIAVLPDPPRVFVGRAASLEPGAGEVLWGQVEPAFLWGPLSARYMDASSATCVFDASSRPLFCSHPMHEPPIATTGAPRGASSSSSLLEWEESGETRYGAAWRLFLGFEFAAPDWTVLSSQPRASVRKPLGALRTAFFLVSSLTLAVVFFLANVQIRWTTRPVEKLAEATRLVAQGEFTTQVTIDTNDEFAALAGSFNEMGRQLESHFQTLAALTEIDRAVLSVLDQGTIVSTVLDKMKRLIACDEAVIALFDPDFDDRAPRARVFMRGDTEEPLSVATPFLTRGDVVELLRNPDHLWLDRRRDSRPYLAMDRIQDAGLEHFLALPMIRDETVLGVLLLGYEELPDQRPDELATARQLADQVAVALSNAQLVDELNELSRGTLTALARTVDAKSEWTFGHSERVAELSVRLARELQLSEAEVERAYRGGLLHDIGKIGVPRTILDKPGSLTDEEMAQVRAHTEIGARILEPIKAFDRIVPIVLHHHERYDGTGYPQGLSGERIPLLARVAAIPDVFDALQSGRPYRAAMSEGKVLRIIREGAGTQFDPEMARVFLHMMEGELVGNVRTG